MRGLLFFLLAVFALVLPLSAQERAPVRGLSASVTDELIAVTSDFRGARITVFGVTPPGRGGGDIVVAVRGPALPAAVMRKQQILGLWLNTDRVVFSEAPAYHALLSTRPINQIASPRAVWELGLDPAALARLGGPTPADADPAAYRAALRRLKTAKGLYLEDGAAVTVGKGGLFKAQVRLPANAPPGEYAADIYFFRGGQALASETAAVLVSRTGIEQRLYALANQRPFLYGLATALLALAAGWAASILFRRS
jgi:uncharacterized protein (TIGR02186 family)